MSVSVGSVEPGLPLYKISMISRVEASIAASFGSGSLNSPLYRDVSLLDASPVWFTTKSSLYFFKMFHSPEV